MRFLEAEDVHDRVDFLEKLQGDEFNAALLCGQEQHKVDELCQAHANALTDLERLPRGRYHWAHRGLTIRIIQRRARMEQAFEVLLRRLQRLQHFTFLRSHVEFGLRRNNEGKRQRGEELSEEEIAAEKKLVVGELYVLHQHRRESMAGYFELDRSLNPRASVRERLEGSVLSLFE